MNPIGVNAWVWVSPPTDESIMEIAPRVKAMGFDLLELGVENPGDWDPARVAEILAASNLGAAVCAAMGPGRDLTDPTTIASTQAYVRVCIDAVVALGGAVVAGPLYTPVGKTWRMDDAERTATIDRLVEGLRPLADYAGERGVRLAIEPLNRFETSFLNTAAQTMEVVDQLDSPAVGVLLDTFHMNIEEKDQAAAIRLVSDKLVHFHACGNDRGAPGADQNSLGGDHRRAARDRLRRRRGHRILHPGQPDHRPRRRHLAPAGRDAGRTGTGRASVLARAVPLTSEGVSALSHGESPSA